MREARRRYGPPGARAPIPIQAAGCKTRESRPMPKEASGWQAHTASGYDGAMTEMCDRLQAEIVAASDLRKAIMADPRELRRSDGRGSPTLTGTADGHAREGGKRRLRGYRADGRNMLLRS